MLYASKAALSEGAFQTLKALLADDYFRPPRGQERLCVMGDVWFSCWLPPEVPVDPLEEAFHQSVEKECTRVTTEINEKIKIYKAAQSQKEVQDKRELEVEKGVKDFLLDSNLGRRLNDDIKRLDELQFQKVARAAENLQNAEGSLKVAMKTLEECAQQYKETVCQPPLKRCKTECRGL